MNKFRDNSQSDSIIEKLKKENETLMIEIAQVRKAFDLLESAGMKLIEAQTELTSAVIAVRQENIALKQLIHLSALSQSRGEVQ